MIRVAADVAHVYLIVALFDFFSSIAFVRLGAGKCLPVVDGFE